MDKIRISPAVSLENLDGGGTYLAKPMLNYIRGVRGPIGASVIQAVETCKSSLGGASGDLKKATERLEKLVHKFFTKPNAPYNKRYGKVYEWCSGPGFIGFELLERGICDSLCLADINPTAVESAKKTVLENGLEDRVSVYLSDNLKSIPDFEMFDLVISNPPNYYSLNPQHPLYEKYKDDLRPNDPSWEIHWEFYRTIKKHLNPGAIMLISEVHPFDTEVCIPASNPIPYDTRPRVPIDDFKEMIQEGGLDFVGCEKFFVHSGVEFWMVISKNPTT